MWCGGDGPEEEAWDGSIASEDKKEEEEAHCGGGGPEEDARYRGVDTEEGEEAQDGGSGLEEEKEARGRTLRQRRRRRRGMVAAGWMRSHKKEAA